MLENISYNDPELQRNINKLVGKPFSFWERIRQKGIGSQRLKMTETSAEIAEKLRPNQINYCNIELRPKGIIIRFRYLLETYGFIIPYHELVLTNQKTSYTLQNKTNYITVSHLQVNKIDHQFFERIRVQQDLDLK